MHVPSPHAGAHAPQSPAQLAQVSPASHVPLPHVPQGSPQYVAAAFTQFSSQPPWQQNGSFEHTVAAHGSQLRGSGRPASQIACGHTAHTPQSWGQVPQVSFIGVCASHTPLPQLPVQVPQSAGQVAQLSSASHVPLPQVGHAPHSLGQDEQVSYG